MEPKADRFVFHPREFVRFLDYVRQNGKQYWAYQYKGEDIRVLEVEGITLAIRNEQSGKFKYYKRKQMFAIPEKDTVERYTTFLDEKERYVPRV